MPTVEHKDITSASIEFKRTKDNTEKWAHGIYYPGAPGAASLDDEESTFEVRKQKIIPMHRPVAIPWTKSHANKTPKPHNSFSHMHSSNTSNARQAKKVDAVIDANDVHSAMSKSLAELLPTHANNTNSAIQIALRESAESADGDILYSFDNKGPSPSSQGRNVDLGGLVDIAEKKWANEQTDKIVKGEYEVLDHEGEVVPMKKGKKSPKQKAVKITSIVSKQIDLEDDDYELI